MQLDKHYFKTAFDHMYSLILEFHNLKLLRVIGTYPRHTACSLNIPCRYIMIRILLIPAYGL